MTGRWSPSIDSFIRNDIFVKETIPQTISALLLHKILIEYIFCAAIDNSGVVFRLNYGSCRNPLGRVLIRTIMDSLSISNNYLLADWNNREQTRAKHADVLSKILTANEWLPLQPQNQPAWIFNLFIHHINSNQCISADIRIPRLSEALPHHLRFNNIIQIQTNDTPPHHTTHYHTKVSTHIRLHTTVYKH